jgi:NADH-quinone oxidoreductase subunit N
MAQDWQAMLIILSVLSMAIGNLAAIAQTNLKRMLAYSAISHMGFMLLGLVTGVVGGDARYRAQRLQFGDVLRHRLCADERRHLRHDPAAVACRFRSREIDDFKGLNKRSPWFAGIMLMMMFSMAGVPFFIGFFAKFSVLQAVVAAGYIWLAVSPCSSR